MIAIVAPSASVPLVELELGVEQIRAAGFDAWVHPQCRRRHRFFAGTDEERAKAFLEAAYDDRFETIWSARGGYGANRILPFLEAAAVRGGLPPRKLLIGYSDSTGLAEFVRARWGWSVLSAPMPGLRSFCRLEPAEWASITTLVRGERPSRLWGKRQLKLKRWKSKAGSASAGEGKRAVASFSHSAGGALRGELIGGNLTVWTTLIGTPYEPRVEGKFVFFEDTDEALYRLDRMVQQVAASGALTGARALVLGNFQNCRDSVAKALKKKPSVKQAARVVRTPKDSELDLIRKPLDERKAIPEIFGELADRLAIPMFTGLPVGHGPEHFPLPLGAEYELGADGTFQLLNWNWLKA
jgi:muramoyltetrapeptide carboxypeptidase